METTVQCLLHAFQSIIFKHHRRVRDGSSLLYQLTVTVTKNEMTILNYTHCLLASG
eukprot:m.64278 g.64278  ORF g.64278 m.64278 type:complete len:56 (-) comp13996_c0_seq15:998-1165(-)